MPGADVVAGVGCADVGSDGYSRGIDALGAAIDGAACVGATSCKDSCPACDEHPAITTAARPAPVARAIRRYIQRIVTPMIGGVVLVEPIEPPVVRASSGTSSPVPDPRIGVGESR